jgi:hypothetical protein
VKKSELLRALQQEILRHDFSTFIDNPPSVAQGGRGICVPGCPACRKRLQTMNQFLHHLTEDALPPLIEKLSGERSAVVESAPGEHRSARNVVE